MELIAGCNFSLSLRRPVRFGPEFRKASARSQRREDQRRPRKLFTPEDIHLLLDEAGVHVQAMLLLGINCAYGPTDCATLPLTAWEGDWIRFPRPKTGIARFSPLWPETRAALETSISRRKTPSRLTFFFVRPSGRPWTQDGISKRFGQLRKASELPRGGFYWLRHTFETVAGGAKDQVAVDCVMGHADHTMAGVYRQDIDPQRLIDVVEHVRKWLF